MICPICKTEMLERQRGIRAREYCCDDSTCILSAGYTSVHVIVEIKRIQSDLATVQEQSRQLVEQYDAKCRELEIAEKAFQKALDNFKPKLKDKKYMADTYTIEFYKEWVKAELEGK